MSRTAVGAGAPGERWSTTATGGQKKRRAHPAPRAAAGRFARDISSNPEAALPLGGGLARSKLEHQGRAAVAADEGLRQDAGHKPGRPLPVNEQRVGLEDRSLALLDVELGLALDH